MRPLKFPPKQQGRLLVHNIAGLVQTGVGAFRRGTGMKELPILYNGYLLIENGLIAGIGPEEEMPAGIDRVLDAKGGWMLPAFVDCHTHLVFAEWRNAEFVDRIRGLSYQEIAHRGGGILNSAGKLRRLSEDELYERSLQRLLHSVATGTAAFEIKSGYGLDTESELKILRVVRRLKQTSGLPIRATFLGAHAYPAEFRQDHAAYMRLLTEEMIPEIAAQGLADYCDAFCENGFFSPDEVDQLFSVATAHGLQPRLHTNQFTHSGGIDLAIAHGALSVDHLEVCDDREIESLLKAPGTAPVLLPYAAMFMGLHQPPARKMIDAGLGLILASDFNPGTSPNPSLSWTWTLACTLMKLLPEEALNAMTINPAFNLDVQDRVGSLAPGKEAHLLLTKPIPDLSFLPYAAGQSWIDRMFLHGNPDFLAN
ncbi:MAG: imidazolonepropionase [Saprospiraceae bacterium]|nr:imidazolonepropionase [Saprospiraceae bacterium]